jgi:hypothetical protein
MGRKTRKRMELTIEIKGKKKRERKEKYVNITRV